MTVSTTPDGICIELHGREQFWALRAKISVLAPTIVSISFIPKFQDWRKWEVRMPGTHAPTKLLAGSYWTEEGWDFLFIRRPIGFLKPRAQNVLVIETSVDKYRRVIISSDKAESERLIAWWTKSQTKPQPQPPTSQPSKISQAAKLKAKLKTGAKTKRRSSIRKRKNS